MLYNKMVPVLINCQDIEALLDAVDFVHEHCSFLGEIDYIGALPTVFYRYESIKKTKPIDQHKVKYSLYISFIRSKAVQIDFGGETNIEHVSFIADGIMSRIKQLITYVVIENKLSKTIYSFSLAPKSQ